MFIIALKMLFGDTAKYIMLVAGLFIATFLIIQQSSIFCGLMLRTAATLYNVSAPIYVVDEKVEQINETNPLRDTDVMRVRSLKSVEWAMPLYRGLQRLRLEDGSYKNVELIGIDEASLAGAPTSMLEGDIKNLRIPNTVIIDELAVKRFSEGRPEPIKVGDVFEINDLEARVVGICDSMRSFTGAPYVWTTYNRALQYAPQARKQLSAVIAAPAVGYSTAKAAEEIEKITGMRTYTNEDFGQGDRDFKLATLKWYAKNTGIPISFGITVIVGLIVGIAIASQTFYAFVLDNLKNLGALKAMGLSNFRLALMLLLQSSTVGCIGYGLGLLLTSGFAFSALEFRDPPFFMPWQVAVGAFVIIQVICMMSALIGIFRLSRYEPAMVFRA